MPEAKRRITSKMLARAGINRKPSSFSFGEGQEDEAKNRITSKMLTRAGNPDSYREV